MHVGKKPQNPIDSWVQFGRDTPPSDPPPPVPLSPTTENPEWRDISGGSLDKGMSNHKSSSIKLSKENAVTRSVEAVSGSAGCYENIPVDGSKMLPSDNSEFNGHMESTAEEAPEIAAGRS